MSLNCQSVKSIQIIVQAMLYVSETSICKVYSDIVSAMLYVSETSICKVCSDIVSAMLYDYNIKL